MVSVATGTRDGILSSLEGSTRRRRKEKLIHGVLGGAAGLSIIVSVAIVLALSFRGVNFLRYVELGALWSGIWRPRQGQFDLPSLVFGSAIVTGIAMLVATPLGLGAAIYLSEYARPRARRALKPVLETLAGIPSVVIGFFAFAVINPIRGARGVRSDALVHGMAAGIGVGSSPSRSIASVAEDAMYAVPRALREGGVRARRPKSHGHHPRGLPRGDLGIVAALILGISRALGETMVVALAAGATGNATRTLNPREPNQTLTGSDRVPRDRVRPGQDRRFGLNAFEVPVSPRVDPLRLDVPAQHHQ